MAQNMSLAQSEVAGATVIDDAVIQAWAPGTDVTVRLIRALVAGCRAAPALNAWYESHAMARRLVPQVHVGIAVDLPDGLFVPVLRDVANRSPDDLRQGLERMRADVKARKIPPEEMRGHTITLSNFGMMAGRRHQLEVDHLRQQHRADLVLRNLLQFLPQILGGGSPLQAFT